MLATAAEAATVIVALLVVTGTALNLSRHPHWYVRGWDFPRPVVVGLAALAGVPYALFFSKGAWYDLGLLAALGLSVVWQLVNIFPYTPLAPKRVKPARRPTPEACFRLVVSNVLMENREFDRWLAVVEAERPDLVIALEVDGAWDERIQQRLGPTHPHSVRHPLDNCYGMALYSRLPLVEPRVEFLVQEDIPSIHARFQLPSGDEVWLHAIHPRPPEPLRHQDSKPRDAELMKVARWIKEAPPRPTIVAGDLNDVAWSYTTNLFLRESGLLDPRLGRGFFNSFNANSRIFRFPLDHIFHSNQFRLVELRRLGHVGSDHFPMLVELSHEPDAPAEQPEPAADASDHEAAEELIERGREAPARGDG